MRLEKIRTKIERRSELLDRQIDLLLREQNPAERIVRISTARLNRDNSLEVRLRSREIALLQRGNSLPIDFVGLRSRILRRSAEWHRENAN